MPRHIFKYQFEIFSKQFTLRIGETETANNNDVMPECFDKATETLTVLINRVARQELKAKRIEIL